MSESITYCTKCGGQVGSFEINNPAVRLVCCCKELLGKLGGGDE